MDNNISYEEIKVKYEQKLREHEKAKTEMIKSQTEIELSIKSLIYKLSELDEDFKKSCGIFDFDLNENTSLEELQKLEGIINNAFDALKGKLSHYLMTDTIDNNLNVVGQDNNNPYAVK